MEYLLMNKDSRMLRFSCQRNEFDEPEFFEKEWYSSYRPIGYGSLATFLERRKAPKHREHIQELLEQFGCDDLEGFIQVTHALLLNDTFWVKDADSCLYWQDVSLYQNEFNQIISEAAFDGALSASDLSSLSPEFGTDGYYAKCWVREGSEFAFTKAAARSMNWSPFPNILLHSYLLNYALALQNMIWDISMISSSANVAYLPMKISDWQKQAHFLKKIRRFLRF